MIGSAVSAGLTVEWHHRRIQKLVRGSSQGLGTKVP